MHPKALFRYKCFERALKVLTNDKLIDEITSAGAEKWYVKGFTGNVERLRIMSKCENQWALIKVTVYSI